MSLQAPPDAPVTNAIVMSLSVALVILMFVVPPAPCAGLVQILVQLPSSLWQPSQYRHVDESIPQFGDAPPLCLQHHVFTGFIQHEPHQSDSASAQDGNASVIVKAAAFSCFIFGIDSSGTHL